VVQVANGEGDSRNEAHCSGTTSGSGTCTVVQGGAGNNNAVCIENDSTPGATQMCDVTQANAGGKNRALIVQTIQQNQSMAEMGKQTANVNQMNGTGSNSLTLRQGINQVVGQGQDEDNGNGNGNDASTGPGDEMQTATQNGSVSQTAGTGQNFSQFEQKQKQHEGTSSPSHQNQTSNQQGSIDQTSNGLSTADVNEDADQHMTAPPGSTQRQDPFQFCCSSQTTNPKNKFKIHQHVNQRANATAFQHNETDGTCATSGQCTVDQRVTENGNTATNQCGPSNACDIAIVCGNTDAATTNTGTCVPLNQCFEGCPTVTPGATAPVGRRDQLVA
jgi:hypothetical protein